MIRPITLFALAFSTLTNCSPKQKPVDRPDCDLIWCVRWIATSPTMKMCRGDENTYTCAERKCGVRPSDDQINLSQRGGVCDIPVE